MTKKVTKLEKDIYASDLLTEAQKDKYLDMLEVFAPDIKVNINLTSIELSESYPIYTIEDWQEFLAVPVISKYIQSLRTEKISREAEKAMTDGSLAGAKLKQIVDADRADLNSRYIIFRLPDKED